MRKLGASTRVLALLLAASIGVTSPALAKPVVAPQVQDELANSADGTAYVIVMLAEPAGLATKPLRQRQVSVGQVQNRVLANLAMHEFRTAYQYANIPALTGRVNSAGLAKLAVDADVLAVGPDAQGQGHLSQSVPFVNADDVHTLGYTGSGITVAVLDSGIDTDHPDLSDNIAAGAYHFLDQGATTGPGAEDDNGHGTNVSGIITSKGQVAPVGVAPDTDILAVKVIKANGSGWVSDWAAGVDYVVSHQDDYDHLGAINTSLGSSTLFSQCPCDNATYSNRLLQASLQAAKNAGIVTFASSGNNGSCTSMSSPACLSAATAVAAVYDADLGREPDSGTYQSQFGSPFPACYDATTAGDKVTCFSNRSPCNALAAPGVLITAPGMGGGTSTYTGTSQASPHCAGVAALMCERADGLAVTLTPDEIVQIMKDTGSATDDPCSTTPNPIRVDALAAVAAIAEPPSILGWRSVRDHGPVAGWLPIALDAAASGYAVGCETRRFGMQRMEVDFNADVSGLLTGTVVAEDLTHGGTIAPTGQYTINGGTTLVIEFVFTNLPPLPEIAGLPDGACYRIDLAGHIPGLYGDTNCEFRVLAGDMNGTAPPYGDGKTDLTDMATSKSMNGAPLVGDSIRFDVNIDGRIDLTDMALVKSLNGGAAICP